MVCHFDDEQYAFFLFAEHTILQTPVKQDHNKLCLLCTYCSTDPCRTLILFVAASKEMTSRKSFFKSQIKYLCFGSVVLELDSSAVHQIWEGSVNTQLYRQILMHSQI